MIRSLVIFVKWVERSIERVLAWLSVLVHFNGVTTKGRHFVESHDTHLLSAGVLVGTYEYPGDVNSVAVRSGHTVSAFGGST